jgi:hypothetical protein
VPDLRTASTRLSRSDLLLNDKVRRLLGIAFIPLEQALLATARSLLEQRLV